MSWTDERIECLTKMWEGGSTASQIADALGGVSRNAVIGKAHRLGLKARPSPVRPNEPGDAANIATAPTITLAPTPTPTPAVSMAEAPAPAAVAQSRSTVATPQAAPPPVAMPAAAASDDSAATDAPRAPAPRVVSVGPGGFLRQGPGDQQAPIPPAPPRRLVPAKPSAEISGKTSLLDLNDRICRWPMGHPGEPDFHFCGDKVNPGFPYCVDHCGRAYQAQLPRGHRRPPPPLPFGGARVR